MIIFAGGEIADYSKFTSRALVVTGEEARANGWRDFRDGLTPCEERLFLPPDERGRLVLSPEGEWRRAAPGGGGLHPHLRDLLMAAGDEKRRYFVTPMPVFQRREGAHAWVVEAAKGAPGTNGFAVQVDGYGRFPVEAANLRSRLGRAHRPGRMSARSACAYGTIFFGGAIETSLAAPWRAALVEARMADRRAAAGGDPRSDAADRPETATLVHDLLALAITGRTKSAARIAAATRSRASGKAALDPARAAAS